MSESQAFEDSKPQWVKDLQLELHVMSNEDLMRFSVMAEINDMEYQQDERPIPPPEFWADVWWRTFELWCQRNGFPPPHKADLYAGRKTILDYNPQGVLH